MKKTILRSLFLTLLLCVNILFLEFHGISPHGFAQAGPLLAQTPSPSAAPQNSPSVAKNTSDSAPNLTPSSSDQPSVKPAPIPQSTQPPTKEEPAPTTGPYDMQAIKAFNRALYGS